MKVVIMPRDRVVNGILLLSLGQCLLCGIAFCVLILWAGAHLQRAFKSNLTEGSGLSGYRSGVTSPTPLAEQQAVDALFVQVGVLQAQYQRLDALSRRVARLAGFAAAELHIVAEHHDLSTQRVKTDTKTLARIGQQLRALQADLLKKTEHFMLFDLALTKHAARVARQPTAMPIAPPAQLSSTYGWRRLAFQAESSVHEGLDFAAPSGTPILAASGGVVRTAANQGSFGNLIEIDHGEGLLTRYAHAKVLLVKKGDLIRRGQMIARVGSTGLSTGPHLHFEVRQHDKPLDPRAYLTGSPIAPVSVPVDSGR